MSKSTTRKQRNFKNILSRKEFKIKRANLKIENKTRKKKISEVI
jgi:hypothetical protein